MTTIQDLAYNLGQIVGQSEIYTQMRTAENALKEDKDARKLVKDFQTLQESYQRMQMLGHPLSEENKATLKTQEEKTMAHPLVKDWYDKKVQFHELVVMVNAAIQKGIGPKPFSFGISE